MSPLQPGVSLLIKKFSGPIVPVGVAGPFAAWPRSHKLPSPSPLFLPPTPGTLSVAIGKPRSSESLSALPREVMLKVLDADIRAAAMKAEEIRRR
jgi:1-acyl-sn-glycerol-3-phosphate acyltransferase